MARSSSNATVTLSQQFTIRRLCETCGVERDFPASVTATGSGHASGPASYSASVGERARSAAMSDAESGLRRERRWAERNLQTGILCPACGQFIQKARNKHFAPDERTGTARGIASTIKELRSPLWRGVYLAAFGMLFLVAILWVNLAMSRVPRRPPGGGVPRSDWGATALPYLMAGTALVGWSMIAWVQWRKRRLVIATRFLHIVPEAHLHRTLVTAYQEAGHAISPEFWRRMGASLARAGAKERLPAPEAVPGEALGRIALYVGIAATVLLPAIIYAVLPRRSRPVLAQPAPKPRTASAPKAHAKPKASTAAVPRAKAEPDTDIGRERRAQNELSAVFVRETGYVRETRYMPVRPYRRVVTPGVRRSYAKAKPSYLKRDQMVPFATRLAKLDAALAKHAGTQAVAMYKERRDGFVAKAETRVAATARIALKLAAEAAKKSAYGEAIRRLDDIAYAYAGTKGVEPLATRLAELRAELRKKHAETKASVKRLVAACQFTAAQEALAAPAHVWRTEDLDPTTDAEFAEIDDDAKRQIEAIASRREAIARDYGKLLTQFDRLLEQGDVDGAETLASQAAAKAKDIVLRRLMEGKARDAKLLLRAMDRVVAGASALRAKLGQQADKRVFVQRANGASLKTALGEATRKGIVLDMPGMSGLVSWGQLSVDQLATFAKSAPGVVAAADLCGLGLLAFRRGSIGEACELLNAALDADAGGAELVVGTLRRHGAGMVHVPEGTFCSGRANTLTRLPSYLIGRTEVSNAEYALFVRVQRALPPPHWANGKYRHWQDELPVANVTLAEASAYATWLGMRLPRADEWEKAVRGSDGRLFPWGSAFEPRRANLRKGGGLRTTDKRKRSASRPGRRRPPPKPTKPPAEPNLWPVTKGSIVGHAFPIYHLSGNVREWVMSPAATATKTGAIGGAAADADSLGRATTPPRRQAAAARNPYTGFRLAWPR